MIQRYLDHVPLVPDSAFVHPNATLIGDVTLGEQASVWPGASLRGDHGAIRIGPRTSIQDGAVAHGTERLSEVQVGAHCTVGHNAILHGCRVADHVLVGMGAILLDNCEIGEWSLIGAGTLVTARKKIPAGVLVLGNPGKVIRDLTEEERRWIDYSWRTYVDSIERYRATPQA
ncbi:gamma carbonic anhydrase family protein [Vulgatibacter sp.]|uniref:gamma carbonic anhydrase family protein n=1 Tax=Vulgatibacter sp. TaxID=1971226 RepID=UPI0035682B4E